MCINKEDTADNFKFQIEKALWNPTNDGKVKQSEI